MLESDQLKGYLITSYQKDKPFCLDKLFLYPESSYIASRQLLRLAMSSDYGTEGLASDNPLLLSPLVSMSYQAGQALPGLLIEEGYHNILDAFEPGDKLTVVQNLIWDGNLIIDLPLWVRSLNDFRCETIVCLLDCMTEEERQEVEQTLNVKIVSFMTLDALRFLKNSGTAKMV